MKVADQSVLQQSEYSSFLNAKNQIGQPQAHFDKHLSETKTAKSTESQKQVNPSMLKSSSNGAFANASAYNPQNFGLFAKTMLSKKPELLETADHPYHKIENRKTVAAPTDPKRQSLQSSLWKPPQNPSRLAMTMQNSLANGPGEVRGHNQSS